MTLAECLAIALPLAGVCVSVVAAVAKDVAPESMFARIMTSLAHVLPLNLPGVVGEMSSKKDDDGK